VIDVTAIPDSGRVIFGTTVRLTNLDNEEQVTYKIVGDDEADIKVDKISVYSPIARALVGKQVDDVVIVRAPSGDIEFEICSVEYI
jgi:transcription elongation factor GreA